MVNCPICGRLPNRKGNAFAGYLVCCDIVGDVGHSEEEIERKWDSIATIRRKRMSFCNKNKEESAMQVTYNGFTGELVKLEKYEGDKAARRGGWPLYDLAIYDSEVKVTHCFEDVKLEDVKFSGGVMTSGG